MNTRTIAFILSLTLLILLTACTGDSDNQPLTNPFLGGTNGVTLKFEQGSPPADTFDNGLDSFDVVVLLKNEGETTINKANAYVTISGIIPQQFGLTEDQLTKQPTDDLIARKKTPENTILESTETAVAFNAFKHLSPISGATQQFTIKADICYGYNTTIITNDLCVRKNLVTPEANGICEPTGQKTIYNSGAPVQVTKLEEATRGKDKIVFTFTVAHVGTGNVYKTASGCDSGIRANENRVKITVDTKLPGLTCSGLTDLTQDGNKIIGYATLLAGPKDVTCAQQVTRPGDYTIPTLIVLSYDYGQSVTTPLTVKKSE